MSTSMEGPGGRERRGWVPAHKRQAAVCQATVAHAGGRDEGGSGGGGGEREGTGHNDGLGVELKRGHSEAGAGEPNRSQGERRGHNGERGTAGYGAVWIGGGTGGRYAVTDHREPRNPGRTVRNAMDGQEHPAWGGVARQRGAARWPVEGRRGALVGPAPGGIKSERKGPSGSQPPPRAIGPQPDALAAPRSPMGDGQCGRRRGGTGRRDRGKGEEGLRAAGVRAPWAAPR